MANKKKVIDPLPDSFENEEAAGEFWDTHSVEGYAEFFEPVDAKIEITERIYEVQVSKEVFYELQKEANARRQSVPKTVDRILRKELSLAK